MSSLRSSPNNKNSKYFRIKLAKKNTRDKSKTGFSSNHDSKKWQKYNGSDKNRQESTRLLCWLPIILNWRKLQSLLWCWFCKQERTNNEITIDQFPRLPLKVSDTFKGSTDITAEEQTSLQDITVTVDELNKIEQATRGQSNSDEYE